MDNGLNTRLCFGKHEGKLISTVIREDPQYILWCLENIDDFRLDWKAERELDYELEERENL